MHTVLMQRYGGASGVRDPGALEAVLFRPQTGYYDDLVAEAAALTESLAVNHPFVDGNKRIAFAAADVCLRINGWHLTRPPMQIYAEMMQMLESGTFDIARLDPWLRGFASDKPRPRAKFVLMPRGSGATTIRSARPYSGVSPAALTPSRQRARSASICAA